MLRFRVIAGLLAAIVFILTPGTGSLASAGFRPVNTVPRMHVVVLGVSEYKSPSFANLRGPTKDAILVASAIQQLGSRAEILSFTALHEPTRERVLAALKEVSALAKASKETVVIYWAGHSHYDGKNDRLYLIPSDGDLADSDPRDPSSVGLKNAVEFADDFLSVFDSQTRVLFLGDGCNIGEGLVGQVAKQYPNLVVFSSSKVDEEVMDIVPSLGHGALAYFIAEALRNPISDLDGDGVLSVDDIFMHIYPRVVEVVRKTALSASQHPTLFGRFSHRIQLASVIAPMLAGDRVALKFNGGVPAEIRQASRVKINGVDVPVVSAVDQSSIEVAKDDLNKLGNGLNEVSWGEEGRKFLVWKERRELSRFEIPYKNSHAVLIAIDDYEAADIPRKEKLKKLGGMVPQAKALASVLRELGFDQIIELYNANATRQKIDEALRTYWRDGENENVDRLFVYYGGHGLSSKDAAGREQSLLATYDYDLSKKTTTTFHANDLKIRHSENIAANHVMFALDVCHSGLVTTKMSRNDQILQSDDTRLALVQAEIQKKARNFLVAGTSDQEALYDNGGVFTAKLIEALKGDADDGDGLLTFSEIGRWVKSEVVRVTVTVSKFRGQRQVPDYDKLGDIGRGEMLFFPGQNVRLIAKTSPEIREQNTELPILR